MVHQTLSPLEGAQPGDDGQLVLHGLVPLEQEVQTAAYTTRGPGTDGSHSEVFLLHSHAQAGQLRHPPDLGGGEGGARGVDPGLAAGPRAVLHILAHVHSLHQQLGGLRGVSVAAGLHSASFGEKSEGEAEKSREASEAQTQAQQGGELVTRGLRGLSRTNLPLSLPTPPHTPASTAPAPRLSGPCLEREVRGGGGDS